jgi:hypothetical protein
VVTKLVLASVAVKKPVQCFVAGVES